MSNPRPTGRAFAFCSATTPLRERPVARDAVTELLSLCLRTMSRKPLWLTLNFPEVSSLNLWETPRRASTTFFYQLRVNSVPTVCAEEAAWCTYRKNLPSSSLLLLADSCLRPRKALAAGDHERPKSYFSRFCFSTLTRKFPPRAKFLRARWLTVTSPRRVLTLRRALALHEAAVYSTPALRSGTPVLGTVQAEPLATNWRPLTLASFYRYHFWIRNFPFIKWINLMMMNHSLPEESA